MAESPYLNCQNISFHVGSKCLFSELSFTLHPGDRLGIVGPNGAGKSTLVQILIGEAKPDSGTLSVRNGIRMAHVTQKFDSEMSTTVYDYLLAQIPRDKRADLELVSLEASFLNLNSNMTNNPKLLEDDAFLDKYSKIQEKMQELDGNAVNNILECAFKLFGNESVERRSLSQLSGGQLKKIQIIGALLQNPQVLLLDEPTNHLDTMTVDWLEEFLLSYAEQGNAMIGMRNRQSEEESCAFLIVSHDRALLDTLASKIFEIRGGQSQLFQGNYEAYAEKRMQLDEEMATRKTKLSNLFRNELAWLRAGVKARTTKQIARIQRATKLNQNIQKLDSKLSQAFKPTFEFDATIASKDKGEDGIIVKRESMGNQVLIEFKGLGVLHPQEIETQNINPSGKAWICKDFKLVVKPKDRIALLGPNGCGKTTLLRIFAGTKMPFVGERVTHPELEMSYFDQDRHGLDYTMTARKFICPDGDNVFFNGKYMHIFAFLDRFLISKYEADKVINHMSGGEQARLLLAKLALTTGNFLVLDEPTNDLDIDTLQALESDLTQYPGGIVFTSHDRYFMNRVATKYLVYSGVKVTGDGSRVTNWVSCVDLDQALEVLALSKDFIPLNVKPELTSVLPEKSPVLPNKLEQGPASKGKLSFKEKKELETLETEIASLETKIPNLHRDLELLCAATNNFSEVKAKQIEIETTQNLLSKNLERWVFLSEQG